MSPSSVVEYKDLQEPTRNWIAFFLFGLINNFAYSLMLSAAKDLIGDAAPVGVVLCADVLPTFLVKLFLPPYLHFISYNFRIIFNVVITLIGFQVCAWCDSVAMRLFGVVLCSTTSGFGEISFLAMTALMTRKTTTGWSSGTGGAGVAASGLWYLIRTVCDVSARNAMLSVSWVPLGFIFTYYFLLEKPPQLVEEIERASVASKRLMRKIFLCEDDSTIDEAEVEKKSLLGDLEADSKPSQPDGAMMVDSDGAVSSSSSSPSSSEGIPTCNAESEVVAKDVSDVIVDVKEAVGRKLEERVMHNPKFRVLPIPESLEDIFAQYESTDIDPKEFLKLLSLKQRVSLITSLLRYMVPLMLVYFSEYTINSGVTPCLWYWPDIMSAKDAYTLYQFLYQCGVLVSRSGTACWEMSSFWLFLPSILQAVNLIFLIFVSVYHFIPTYVILFIIVFYEGLLGGHVYAQAFNAISVESHPLVKEYGMGAASVGNSFGILVSSVVSSFLETWLDNYQ
ncbi:Batten's disease protein Cln3 like protein [Aduncisulcus paluster]|uniref:Batten's disease protein Cln3 like protein n=1 Tax=Aduncisulcus paluster TaxID=2918883 RepID=A0ABQ5K194_9EUKA|nr:Batten's disease protein Cln3 like protein [Aduncisulcus paluster]